MTALTNIPPAARNALYLASFIVGIALGGAQVGYQAAEAGFPVWLKVALSVYAFLAATLGLTASANTPSFRDVVAGDAEPPAIDGQHRDDRGAGETELILRVMALVIAVIVVVWLLRALL